MAGFSAKTIGLFLITLSVCASVFSQTPASDSGMTTFHAGTQLVLVDVIPEYTPDSHSRSLLTELKREDFRVFDNRKEMSIAGFDIGVANQTRPIALWLIVQCPLGFQPGWASDFIRGKTQYLSPALAHLAPNDVVGVAHWCDNGIANIDLSPVHDPAAALATVDQVMSQKPAHGANRSGELAMQQMIRMVVSDVQAATPDRLPVLVFLYGDHSGTSLSEADKIIESVLESSGVVFGISDNGWRFKPDSMFGGGNVDYLVHYYSQETGGGFYGADDPKLYSAALDYVLSQLHLRYTLSFKPLALDGKRHQLKVELTKNAQGKFRGAQLRHRQSYIPIRR
jgi:hypothetical protein